MRSDRPRMQHRLGHTTATMALYCQAATTERDQADPRRLLGRPQINTATAQEASLHQSERPRAAHSFESCRGTKPQALDLHKRRRDPGSCTMRAISLRHGHGPRAAAKTSCPADGTRSRSSGRVGRGTCPVGSKPLARPAKRAGRGSSTGPGRHKGTNRLSLGVGP